MAKIVLGLASSHTPQLSVPANQWHLLREKDETDPRLDYPALLRQAKSGVEAEITPEKMQERDDTCQKALDGLKAVMKLATPDVLVVLGDDQHEQFLDDNMPMFCVYRGASLPVGSRQGRQGDTGLSGMSTAYRAVERHTESAGPSEYPAAPELAEHLIGSLINDGFDVSCSNQLRPDVGIGHAFSFVFRRLMPDGPVPMVPVMINTFYPPNAPSARRSYALGQAIRRSVEDWESDQRVAIIASGGLSHVIIDEELDRALIEAMLEKDVERLCAFPADRMTLGTSENRNWIALAGAMELKSMLLAQYLPCYRTPAGTGCGMGFAYWM